jgi:hypothetical protein
MRRFFSLLVGLGYFVSLQAQEASIPQNVSVLVPANATNIALPGMVLMEFLGVCKTYMRDGRSYLNTPTTLSTGVAKDLELRLSGNTYSQSRNLDGSYISGSGDIWAGIQWCPVHDGIFKTETSLQYMHKFPTASKDLSSGLADDTLGLIFNRFSDHWDWVDGRIFYTWLRRPQDWGGGTARQTSASLSMSHPLNLDWSIGGKLSVYSNTFMSARSVSIAPSLSRRIGPGFYLTAGVDCGLNRDAAKYTVVLGASFWVGPPRRAPSPVFAPKPMATRGFQDE